MTIHNTDVRHRTTRLQINLRGPEGNAYCILGYAKQLAEQLGKDWSTIEKEMMSDDYENLIQVFDREFGMFVDIWR